MLCKFGFVSTWRSCACHQIRQLNILASNQRGIEVLPDEFKHKVFPKSAASRQASVVGEDCTSSSTNAASNSIDQQAIAKVEKEPVSLKENPSDIAVLYDFESLARISLPPLRSKVSLSNHFKSIAKKQSELHKIAVNHLIGHGIPVKPDRWVKEVGWVKYDATQENGYVSVGFPDEDALVFDVEVCVTESECPVMATAVSSNAWYSWCSPLLVIDHPKRKKTPFKKFELPNLIQLEGTEDAASSRKRIIIGHNVSYDRKRVREQYYLERTNLRFLDTMSLHIAICGFSNDQREIFEHLSKGSKHRTKALEKVVKDRKGILKAAEKWRKLGSKNSLLDVWEHHCPKSTLTMNKQTRNVFVDGSLQEIRADFQNLMRYCATDVEATFEVLKAVWPPFVDKRCRHPVTFAGMLEMSTMYVPVTRNWPKFLDKCAEAYDAKQAEITTLLAEQAKVAVKELNTDGKRYLKDAWLWDADWSLAKAGKMAGLPKWFKDLCSGSDADHPRITAAMNITPKLLGLSWLGYPLYHDSMHGWGFLVPGQNNFDEFVETQPGVYEFTSSDGKTTREFPYNAVKRFVNAERKRRGYNDHITGKQDLDEDQWILCEDVILPGCAFYKLPHKDGPNSSGNLGSPLAKHFIRFIEDGSLQSTNAEHAKLIAKVAGEVSYWTSNRGRLNEQLPVWFASGDLPEAIKQSSEYSGDAKIGAIVPQLVTAGAMTRRATEATWLTSPNAEGNLLGSEVKGIVEAPPGYCFVGADVDVQELWIASIVGDCAKGVYGSTDFSKRVLEGRKENGTDYHTFVAGQVGIIRQHAKVLNFARLYGGGIRHATNYLSTIGKMSLESAKNKAFDIYKQTKGSFLYEIEESKQDYFQHVQKKKEANGETKYYVPRWVMSRACAKHNATPKELSLNGKWEGGWESEIFNYLENIVSGKEPRTPALRCQISNPLEPDVVGDEFLPSRINWVIQSSGVDFLHLLLTCIRWLFDTYEIRGRIAMTIHDEVRFLVREEDKFRAALALQISNLLTRAMFAEQLGFDNLPTSVAFFTKIDIDKVLRKEVDMDCVTPSNPEGLQKEYGIPFGKALTIQEIIAETRGSLRKPIKRTAKSVADAQTEDTEEAKSAADPTPPIDSDDVEESDGDEEYQPYSAVVRGSH